VAGLEKLEYRGYDSAGISLISEGRIDSVRAVGNLANLRAAVEEKAAVREGGSGGAIAVAAPPATTGVAHTRWATHGRVTEENAHPHGDCSDRIHIVLNGIVENHAGLRRELAEDGHSFSSETDAEIVAHLIERHYEGDLTAAVRAAFAELRGHYAFVAMHAEHPELLVGARKECPLVAGIGDGETFLASAIPAFLAQTRNAMLIENDEVVTADASGVRISDAEGNPVERVAEQITWDEDAAEKGGYETFMLKEIHEQPDAVAETIADRLPTDHGVDLSEVALDDDFLRSVRRIVIVACGTAYHAGLVAKYAIEHWTRLPVEIEMASEFRYRDPVLDRNTLVIAISQSGETADTLAATRYARRQRARVLTVCNTVGASIPRESDAVLYTRAGPEVCVAATKTFAAQILAMYLVALYLGQVRGTMFPDEIATVVEELDQVPAKIQTCLDRAGEVRAVAEKYASAGTFLFLGRHVGYPMALEGALKLKEISYIHAEGYPAGELKHGPIALIEDGTPVVVVHPSSHVHAKTVTNMQEVASRGAAVICIAEDNDRDAAAHALHVLRVPSTASLLSPLVTLVPLQLLSYHVAEIRGCPIDKPRNLAKSVTVE
jgi:glutamine---fructose-6-phosphate transaminase (isomerizing)